MTDEKGGNPEQDVVPISALNQYVFCPRRCALMHIEGTWADNEHTVLGALAHQRTDEVGYHTENQVKVLRGLPLFSERYRLVGKADVVELHPDGPRPVEFKKGRRKSFENDDVQVCAQAFCLEEMFGVTIAEGFVYYAASNRRRLVSLDAHLRAETARIIEAVRQLLKQGGLPPAVLLPRCNGCSLRAACLPELSTNDPERQIDYMRRLWKD